MNIWENALMIFLDTDEASVVRENAALFLTNLCSNFVTGNTENLSQPMIMDQPTFKNVCIHYILVCTKDNILILVG